MGDLLQAAPVGAPGEGVVPEPEDEEKEAERTSEDPYQGSPTGHPAVHRKPHVQSPSSTPPPTPTPTPNGSRYELPTVTGSTWRRAVELRSGWRPWRSAGDLLNTFLFLIIQYGDYRYIASSVDFDFCQDCCVEDDDVTFR